jgi:predicted TIM-barrel fold metal-dependent hydrolase
MRVIDAHVHVLDRAWIPDGMLRAWARQAAAHRHPEREPDDVYHHVAAGWNDPTGELTVAAWDRAGVSGGVTPVVDWTIVGQPCGEHLPIRELNLRNQAIAQRWMGRYWFCAGVDPRHGDAREIATEGLDLDACVGLKLYPAAGWDADDARHDWIYLLALDRDVPVVVHTAAIGGDPLRLPNSRPAALVPVLAKHPDLTLVFAHAGFEAWWQEAVDLAAGWRRVFLDISLWQGCARRDYTEFRARMSRALQSVGAHRVIFASDIIRGPRSDPAGDQLMKWLDFFRGLGEPFAGAPAVATAEQMELMLSGSAGLAYGPLLAP